MVNRAMYDCLGVRKFGKQEIKQILEFFGKDLPECVFCGSKDVKRWDHLVSIKQGGETILGNMVPACASCDDSKRDLYFEEWMVSDSENSPTSQGIKDIDKKIKHIKAYMRNFGYTPQSLNKRLTRQEFKRWKEINSRLMELRKDIDMLINDYRIKRP